MMKSITMLIESAPLLMQGVLMTLQLWVGCAVLSLCFGMLLGIIRTRRLRIAYVSRVCDVMTAVLRGIPFYVLLLIAYYVLPELVGVNVSAYTAAIVALGLCSASYVSQSIRSCIDSIADGQWEAAKSMGFSTLQTIWFIILPQMLRTVVPMLSAEFDQLLKSTSIISSIGVLELTRAGMNIVAREMNPLPVYLAIAGMYLIISTGLAFVAYKAERAVWYPR